MEKEWMEKWGNGSVSEEFTSLFEKERERLTESLRKNIGTKKFKTLTQMEIDYEIILNIM